MDTIPADAPNPYDPFNFLILGAGRSGTTLVSALLDQHSELTVEVELGGQEYLRGKGIPERADTVFQDRAEGFLHSCLDASRDCQTAQWGNKITTEQLAGLNRHNLFVHPPLDVLDQFFNHLLAPIKVVFVIRDGRACIQSKLRRTEQSLELACKHWKYSVEVLKFLKIRGSMHLIRFEDLVTQPEGSLRLLCEFLDIEYEAGMKAGSDSSKMLEPYRRPTIESRRAHDVDLSHPSTPFISEELEYCGYSVGSP